METAVSIAHTVLSLVPRFKSKAEKENAANKAVDSYAKPAAGFAPVTANVSKNHDKEIVPIHRPAP